MSLSAEFQAQLDRLVAFLASLVGLPTQADLDAANAARDAAVAERDAQTAALTAALDTANVPPAA